MSPISGAWWAVRVSIPVVISSPVVDSVHALAAFAIMWTIQQLV